MSFFAAWEGSFSAGQIADIIQMSLFAEKKGVKLHDELQQQLAKKTERSKDDKGFIKKPIRKCPKCGGVLKLFSVHVKESSVYKSKWECCKTCKSGGCGYKEYLTKEVETIIEEVNNGSPQ